MAADYVLCGLRVRSALAMPELFAWNGDDRPVDVEVSFGAIQEPNETPVWSRPFSRLWAGGAYLLDIAKVGRFFTIGGNKIVLEPAAGAEQAALRLFTLGTSFGVLCHQRGLLPLHASAVRLDGKAVVIAGNSGQGKSTLSAALRARGHALVGDDLAVVDSRGPFILPAYPQHKLSPDVLETLGFEHEGLQANRQGMTRFCVSANDGFDPSPLTPSVIYILEAGLPEQVGEIERLNTTTAMTRHTQLVYRRGVGQKIQTADAVFRTLVGLSRTTPTYSLRVGLFSRLAELGRLAEKVESHARSLTIK